MENETKGTQHGGIRTLTGDPRQAIIKLSIPMVVAMSVQTVYQLISAIWVSGMGSRALAAVGFFFPFSMLMIALSTGIATGAGSAISRCIGAKDQQGANEVAVHGLYITMGTGILLSIVFTIFTRPIMMGMGAKDNIQWAVDFAGLMFAGSFISFFQGLAATYLRSEGDAKRAMNAMLMSAGLNIILDPFFIYSKTLTLSDSTSFTIGLNMGVRGAAIATLISMIISCIPLFYWLFLKKDTYVSFLFKEIKLKWNVTKTILNVGIPTALSQASMAVMMFFLTLMIASVNHTNGVAIFTSGWRIVMMAILPIIGISTAVIAVCGAAYGSRDYKRLAEAYTFSIKIALGIQAAISVATFVFAPYLAKLFTWSAESSNINADLILMIRIMSFYYPAVPFGMLSAAMFQGVGKGFNSLVITIIRTIVITLPFAALFAFGLNLGLEGVWFGLIAGTTTACVIGFIWGLSYIRKLTKVTVTG